MKEYSFINPDPTLKNNLMSFGCECGDGWLNLLEELFDELQNLVDNVEGHKALEVIQVKEKWGCYDEETEVLTDNGWKFFKNVTFKDKIASLKDGKYLEYQTPLKIFKYDYAGKMYKLKTRGVDLLVTPNHKLYVAKPDKLNGRYRPYKRTLQSFKLQTYEKLFLKNKKFKKGVIWNGKEQKTFTVPGYTYSNFMKVRNRYRTYIVDSQTFKMDAFLRFLGWYIAEGCTTKEGHQISIACCNVDNGKERQTLSDTIKDMGYPIRTTMENKSALIFNIYDTKLGRWLLKNCGHLAPNKKIPGFIKGLSSRQIRIVLDALYAGDGHKAPTSHILTTTSKQLSNDVQELIFKEGRTFRERSRIRPKGAGYQPKAGPRRCYEVNWMKKTYHNTSEKGLSKSSFEGMVDHEGLVYCVEVPSHIIFVRRNGKGVWCGNSLCVYLNYYTNESEAVIDKYVEKSKYVCEWCGKKGKLRNDSGWFTTLCDDCHAKRLENMQPDTIENGKTIDQICDNCYRTYQIPENSTVSRCPFCSTKK